MRQISHFKKWIVTVMVGLLALTTLPACFGGFVLTRKWHGFISGISNKWLRWIVFFITSFVYGIAIFVDAILFNSIEFWSGSNPMAYSDYDENGEVTKTLEQADERVVFTYQNYGERLRIDMWKAGDYKGNMVLLRAEPGQFYTEQNGELKAIEVDEQELENARLVSVRMGDQLLVRKYSVMEYYALRRAAEELPANRAASQEMLADQPVAPAAVF